MTEIIRDSIDMKAVELLKSDPETFCAQSGPAARNATDFLYNVSAVQLESVGDDDLDAHYRSTPIHDQVARDVRSLQLQQPQLILDVDGTMFKDRSGHREPTGASIFDGLIAIVEEAETPSVWDRIEEILQSVQVYACILALGSVFAFIAYFKLMGA
jgi:hypothetical protein